MEKKRSRFAAIFLSLLATGLGQLYKGQGRKAVAIWLAGIALFAAAKLGAVATPFGFIGVSIVALLFFVWVLVDAGRKLPGPIHLRWYNRWYIYLAVLILLHVVADVASTNVKGSWEAFKMPSGSMEPTLKIGDHFIVDKDYYGTHAIARGDIVVFHLPDDPATIEDESKISIIKRVAGIGGDTVEVRGDQYFLNNTPVDEPYARWQEGGLREGNFGPMTVPVGKVFLLGDNRDHSRDSRFWHEPFLEANRITGKAQYIYFSWADMDRVGTRL